MDRTPWTCLLLALGACFNPDPSTDAASTSADTDTDAGTSAPIDMETLGGGTDPSSSNTSDADTDPAETSATDADTTRGDADTSSSSGEPAQLGPQVVMSAPSDGDDDANIGTYFLVHFDRPVSINEALGHVFVSQEGGEPQLIAPQPCPPDADPLCLAGIFPESFLDPETGRLPSNTAHEIIIAADLPDLDDNTNAEDQVLSFRTFTFENDFYDDSSAITQELGGLAYDTTNDALFVAGLPTSGDCIVRRVDIDGGNPSPALTVATPVASGGGPLCYGLSFYEDNLFLAMTYAGEVWVYDELTANDLDSFGGMLNNPDLAAPHDTLQQVSSVAQVNGRRFFGYGRYFGGPPPSAIVERSGGAWSIFQSGTNLWLPDDEVGMATGIVGGAAFMYVHSRDALYAFRLSDGALMAEAETEQMYDTDVVTDAFGRVYVGSNSALRIFDGADLTLLEERTGLPTGRIAVDAEASSAVVYYAQYRGAARIGRMQVTFD